MPAAVAIPLISAAATGAAALGSAKIQSNAASKAQQAQQTATDNALAVQQQASAPYRALGQTGIDRLNALGAPQPYTQQFRAPGGGPQSNGYQPFQPQGGSLGGFAAQPNGMSTQPGGRSGAPLQGGPPMVTLRAPDGSTKDFAAQDAQQVIAQARAAGHELQVVN